MPPQAWVSFIQNPAKLPIALIEPASRSFANRALSREDEGCFCRPAYVPVPKTRAGFGLKKTLKGIQKLSTRFPHNGQSVTKLSSAGIGGGTQRSQCQAGFSFEQLNITSGQFCQCRLRFCPNRQDV